LGADATHLPDTEWAAVLNEDRRTACQESPVTGHYRTLTFASGKTARWWITPYEQHDAIFLLDVTA